MSAAIDPLQLAIDIERKGLDHLRLLPDPYSAWNAIVAALRTKAAIESNRLYVFPPERWKGDAKTQWTVRKEDQNQNVIAQTRAESLDDAVAQCVAALGPRVGVGQEGIE